MNDDLFSNSSGIGSSFGSSFDTSSSFGTGSSLGTGSSFDASSSFDDDTFTSPINVFGQPNLYGKYVPYNDTFGHSNNSHEINSSNLFSDDDGNNYVMDRYGRFHQLNEDGEEFPNVIGMFISVIIFMVVVGVIVANL